ncbi:hypothetical protein M0R45_015297 [Rubus argutus]|uniref:Reverse transcriptase domain-containing protein n=1 Tax=Rubus argutus TaxID=59490 RepID=A0AAW1XQ60_RUBAR
MAGGLSLWWKPEFHVDIILHSKYFIDTVITCGNLGAKVCVTWMYGPPYYSEKSAFWESWQGQQWNDGMPWHVIGDFNELMWSFEKVGGAPWNQNRNKFLNDFVASNNLIDIGFKGTSFTWFRKEFGEFTLKERLDRGLISDDWLMLWPNSCLTHLSLIGSDQCPLLFNFCPTLERKGKPFKFESFWADDVECLPIIQNNWKNLSFPCNQALWRQNLSACRSQLSKWSCSRFSKNRHLIRDLQAELDSNLLDSHFDCARRDEITNQLSLLWSIEEKVWHQKSRISWLTAGDQNTRFFHLTTLHRRQRNRILKIADDSGTWIVGERAIRCEFESQFQKVFACQGPRFWGDALAAVHHVVTEDMNLNLTAPFSLDEVKAAAFQLGALKSPGPDGFPGLFFHKFWDVVNNLVYETSLDFGSGLVNLSTLNQTHIALIPKIPNPERTSHFRPISLCNNSYKILSKLIANRLKAILPALISHNQNAFVPNRQIQDNILLAHESYHYLKLKREGGNHDLGLKLDMNKAYDRVEWDFLEAALLKFGFDRNWVRLVMSYVISVSFSIVLDGNAGAFFKPKRGLRQGDPLSPYLFLIVSEVLSLRITKAVHDGHLTGIRLSRSCPVIYHLFFADDALYFLKATLPNCWVLKLILNEFCLASGQLINHEKSSIYFSPNTPLQMQYLMCELLGITLVDHPGSYLGLPTIWGKSKKEALSYIKDRVIRKIDSWKLKSLSSAGKEIFLKSVASAVPAYPMSCFKFPASICNEINASLSNFWWGENESNNKLHWKSWSYLGKSKLEGGLGFRDFHSFNLALLAKQCWKLIHEPFSFWARVMKARYFPLCDFSLAVKGYRASWSWASLLEARDIILSGSSWQFGNGLSIRIWTDSWLPPPHEGSIVSIGNVPPNAPVFVNQLVDWQGGSWNLRSISPYLSPDILQLISLIPIGDDCVADRLIWPWNKNGLYSVKSGYHWLHSRKAISLPNIGHNSHFISSVC